MRLEACEHYESIHLSLGCVFIMHENSSRNNNNNKQINPFQNEEILVSQKHNLVSQVSLPKVIV